MGFGSYEDAREAIARRIYVHPDTDAMVRLEHALQQSLHEQDGVWRIDGAEPLRPCVVSWQPTAP